MTKSFAVFVSVSTLLLTSCTRGAGQAPATVEDSSRPPAAMTQPHQPPPAVQQPAPQPPAPPTAPVPMVTGRQNITIPPLSANAPANLPQAPSVAQAPSPSPSTPDTVRGERPVGTSGRMDTLPDGRLPDAVLEDRVEAAFAVDPLLRGVTVTVDDGIIMLRGTVTDTVTRDRAFALAKSVSGARGVVARFSGR